MMVMMDPGLVVLRVGVVMMPMPRRGRRRVGSMPILHRMPSTQQRGRCSSTGGCLIPGSNPLTLKSEVGFSHRALSSMEKINCMGDSFRYNAQAFLK